MECDPAPLQTQRHVLLSLSSEKTTELHRGERIRNLPKEQGKATEHR